MRAIVLLILAGLPAFASEPGQPLGAEDLVVLLPGLWTETAVPRPCPSENPAWCSLSPGPPAVDVDGFQYAIRSESLGLTCAPPGESFRWIITRLVVGGVEEDVAYIDARCVTPTGPVDYARFHSLHFDLNNGALYVAMETWDSGVYLNEYSLVRIRGFATELEILQTYTPISDLSFRVPAIPEGFPAADYFDTYYGDLATVGDWRQAQPLQCGYPASPPSAGEYIEVEDPLPNPNPGHGRYYVTAVHYAGQTRYGRKSMGGVLSGRDPVVLPGCTTTHAPMHVR